MKISKKSREQFNILENNFGFTWEIFIKELPWEYRNWVCIKHLLRLAETGRLAFKTETEVLAALWQFCTFGDANFEVLRKDKQTHKSTTLVKFQKVCKRLLDKYDIDLGPDNINGIKWEMADNAPSYRIVHPDGREINFDNIGKFKDGQLGKEYLVGGGAEIWVDEVSRPSKDGLEDDDSSIYTNVQMLMGSLVRSNFKSSNDPIPEFKTTYPVFDKQKGRFVEDANGEEFTVHINGIKKTKRYKVETIYFHKKPHITFTMNAWDPSNLFHEKYFEDVWPLDPEVENLVLNQNFVNVERKEDEDIETDKRVLLVRASAWISKDHGWMSHEMEEYLLTLRDTNYIYYKTVALGLVLETQDKSKYVFRNELRNCKTFEYGVEWPRIMETGTFIPEQVVIGLDWGYSKLKAKKSVIEVTALSFWDGKKWNFAAGVGEWYGVSKSNRVDAEDEKIRKAAKFIAEEAEKYRPAKIRPVVWYDPADRVVANAIRQELLISYNFDLRFQPGAKHDRVNNKWDVESRIQWFKRFLASGRYFIDPKQCKVLWQELSNMIYEPGSFKWNKKSANDGTTAVQYSFTLLHKIFNLKPLRG